MGKNKNQKISKSIKKKILFLLRSIKDVAGIVVHKKTVSAFENPKSYMELEEQFITSVAQMGVTAWILDMKSHVVVFKQNNENLFGMGDVLENVPDSIINGGVVHPDDRERMRQMYLDMYAGKKEVASESRWLNKVTGEYNWRKTAYTVIFDKKGTPVRAIGSGIDITEQKNAEKKYREQNNYRMLLAQKGIASSRLNLTKNTIRDQYVKVPGLENVMFVETVEDHFIQMSKGIPMDKEREDFQNRVNISVLLKKFSEGNNQLRTQFRSEFHPGRTQWMELELNMILNPYTGDIESYCLLTDITDQVFNREIVESILQYEVEKACVIDIKQDIFIAFYDREPHKIKRSWASIPYEKTIKEYLFRTCVKEEREENCRRAELKNVISGIEKDGHYEMLIRINKQDGSISCKQLRYYYSDQMHTRILFFSNDITEVLEKQQEVQQSLAKALSDAKEASRAKSEFLSRMSHEIRTPMNAILGLAFLGQKNERNDMPPEECFVKIQKSGEYLLGLINDILEMSRIESGKVKLQEEKIRIDNIFDSVLDVVKPLADQRQVELVTSFEDENIKHITTDFMRIKQIFINLLNNAVKFSNPGNHVEWITRVKKIERDTIYVESIVQDYGCGMGKAFLNRIFIPFEQENNSYSDTQPGTGLGLAIVKNLVDQMGGEIKVESRQGEGSRFILQLTHKICMDGKDKTEKNIKESFENLSGKKILLVEDNEINTEVAKQMLKNQQMQVICVPNGRAAVEQFKASAEGFYAAILMDIRMPVMNGLEAAAAIRSLGREDAKAIPIIAMTADAFAEDMEKTKVAGMNAHLSKPIMPQMLYQVLDKWIAADIGG